MIRMKNLIVFFITFISIALCQAQLPPGNYSSKNKKAIALFEGAIKLYQSNQLEKAKAKLSKAVENDATFIEPHLLLAEIFQENEQIQNAIDEYTKAIEINPRFNLNNFYNLAQLEMRLGKYAEAKQDYKRFLVKINPNPDSKETAERQLASCNFAIEAMKHPVPFEPKNMGRAINSEYSEYFPAITADEQLFLFTRNMRMHGNDAQEDFFISKKVNGVWQTATLIGSGINSKENEGAPSLSADGQVLFFTVCVMFNDYGNGRKGYGACDIFYAQKIGENWSKAYNLGPTINTQFRETQPSFSADGKSLYFISNRPGGFGAHDIYVSSLKEDGSWGTPVNLGSKINTSADEQSVFIHPDGKTLYFSSNGRIGMGGYDIYVSRMDANGEWGTPVNLGYPINTYNDENSLLVTASGKVAYFSSDRAGGYGGLDLYQFDLYEAAQPEKITYVKGNVYDLKTKAPLGAHFELINLETGKSAIVSDANPGNGQFLLTLPAHNNYALTISQPGYLFYSENFALKELADETKPFFIDVPMQPIDTGSIIELKNVFFETAKFELKPESKVELNKLIAFLNVNKTLYGELCGHTDNIGDKKSNVILSKNRAKAVYDYLIANGVDAKQLTYKGYGDAKPKVKNDSDENRSQNRRTEFKVLKKK